MSSREEVPSFSNLSLRENCSMTKASLEKSVPTEVALGGGAWPISGAARARNAKDNRLNMREVHLFSFPQKRQAKKATRSWRFLSLAGVR
jgi:hypothetical protein